MKKHLLIALAFVLTAIPADAQISREALEKVQAAIDEALQERIVHVTTADELTAALKDAKGGLTVEADPGVVYRGAFVLPPLPPGERATLRVRGVLSDRRMSPADGFQLATLRAPAGSPPLTVGSGWTVDGFVFEAEGNAYGLVRIGPAEGYESVADITHHVELRRFVIAVPDDQRERRGVMANGGHVVIRQCWITGIKEDEADSQAISGWDFPGPLTIEDCHLEAASEVILIGGSDASIAGMTPSDIRIVNNDITRPLSMRGKPWNIKTLVEIKHGRRVQIIDNRLSNNWHAAQTGYAILLTPRNQGGNNKWAVVEDVLVEGNTITESASGINLLGTDDEKPSGRLSKVMVRNNFWSLSAARHGGDGRPWMMLSGPHDVTFDHNTFLHDGPSIGMVEGPKASGFVYTNNVHIHGQYGIIGAGTAPGTATLNAFFDKPIVLKNVFAGASQAGASYPATNLTPTVTTFNGQFNADWTLKATSAWKAAGTDGKDLGASLP